MEKNIQSEIYNDEQFQFRDTRKNKKGVSPF